MEWTTLEKRVRRQKSYFSNEWGEKNNVVTDRLCWVLCDVHLQESHSCLAGTAKYANKYNQQRNMLI